MTYNDIKIYSILNISNGHSVFAQKNLEFDVSRFWSQFSVLYLDYKGKTICIEVEVIGFESYLFSSNHGLLLTVKLCIVVT